MSGASPLSTVNIEEFTDFIDTEISEMQRQLERDALDTEMSPSCSPEPTDAQRTESKPIGESALLDDYRSENAMLKRRLAALTKSASESTGRGGRVRSDGYHVMVSSLEDQLKALQKDLKERDRENQTLQRLIHAKNRAIEDLSHRIDEIDERPQDVITDLKNQLRDKDRQIMELTKKNKTLQRIQERKNKTILELNQMAEDESGPGSLAHFQQEKRVLESEVSRQREIRQKQQRTIKNQDYMIRLLTAKVNMIADTIRDMKAVEAPVRRRTATIARASRLAAEHETEPVFDDQNRMMVPIDLLDTLESELQRHRTLVAEKESEVSEKEDFIENLERKVDILNNKIRVDKKQLKQRMQTAAAEVDTLREAIASRDEDYKKQENVLKSEIFHLRAQLAKMQTTLRGGSPSQPMTP